MTPDFSLSVVIPVYNAAPFIEDAVKSVLEHPVVKEIILVEDGSSDESLKVCQNLSSNSKVKLITHDKGQNLGAGPSRNAGINAAYCEWIGFLDADDLWLTNRFEHALRVIEAHPDADGVYECLGIQFENELVESKWMQLMGYRNTTLNEMVAPEELIFSMAPLGKNGWFSGDALIVKKSLLLECGAYSALKLNQDTELFMKLAIKGRLYPGNIEEPVAVRRVHTNNRISTEPFKLYAHRFYMWKQFVAWCLDEHISHKIISLSWRRWLKVWLVNIRLQKGLAKKIAWLFKGIVAIFNPRVLLKLV